LKVQKKRVLTFLRHEYFFLLFPLRFIRSFDQYRYACGWPVSKEIPSTKKRAESGVEGLADQRVVIVNWIHVKQQAGQ
jgi:hypothetical protein